MSIDLAVDQAKWRRVVTVRFERAKTGAPDINMPQPDDRGYADATHGPIFGICQGETRTVRLCREMIDNSADIFVKSSDTSIFEVVDPAPDTLLPHTEEIDVKIKGVAGDKPKKAKLEVRFCTSNSSPLDGPIIHQAGIWVWHPVSTIPVLPHNVTISAKTGTPNPTASTANIGDIMKVADAIWRPCGIRFIPANGKATWADATKSVAVSLANAGAVAEAELDEILKLGLRTAGVVNAFFVHRLFGTFFGFGFAPADVPVFGLSHHGIILADGIANPAVSHTTEFAGNDLAHEVGHFLGLSHCENINGNSPTDLEDVWSNRSLMYHANPFRPATTQRKVGYGTINVNGTPYQLRGAMVTKKDLAQRTTDAECDRARSNLNSF